MFNLVNSDLLNIKSRMNCTQPLGNKIYLKLYLNFPNHL